MHTFSNIPTLTHILYTLTINSLSYTHHTHTIHTLSLSLSYCSYDDKVEHYRVRRNKKGHVTVDDEEFFENLFKLVEVCQHVFTHTHAREHTHARTRKHTQAHENTTHAYMHACSHAYLHKQTHTYIHTHHKHYTCMHTQHYQQDADGLCSRLKFSVDKTKDIEYIVSIEDFKERECCCLSLG